MKQRLTETWSGIPAVRPLIKQLIRGEIVLYKRVSEPKANILNVGYDAQLHD